MPASQSQIASLLTWLAVSVFLLAGAPVQRRAPEPAGIQNSSTQADDLANAVAAHVLDRVQDDDQISLPRAKDAFDAAYPARCSARTFLPSRDFGPRLPPAVALPRSTLVGLIELRL